jgi:hypothetical protein
MESLINTTTGSNGGAEAEGGAEPAGGSSSSSNIGGIAGGIAGALIGTVFGSPGIGFTVGQMAGTAIQKGGEAMANQKAPNGPGATIQSGSVGAGGPTGGDMALSSAQSLQKLAMKGLKMMPAPEGYENHF